MALLRGARAALPLVLLLLCLGPAAAGAGAAVRANSADRMIIWVGCPELPRLSDAELDAWQDRGVDGFACESGWLDGLGGVNRFTTDPNVSLSGERFELQRGLRDTGILDRLRARGMKAYLGVYFVNYWNTRTPLVDWFDDAGWEGTVLPGMRRLAGAARELGFSGLAFDQELYPQHDGGQRATWHWDYPGNGRPEGAVRKQVRQRGRQLMGQLVESFPSLEILAYDVQLPGSWGELVQREVNGHRDPYGRRVDIDLWNGMSSVEGYGMLRLADAMFYKVPHRGTWDTAFQYAFNSLYAQLSRKLSNWQYASSRLAISPFAWIDSGPSEWESARPVDYVRDQLMAFRRWGMEGEFANFSYRGLRGFDYGPYSDAMAAASRPAVVDSERPALEVGADGRTLTGSARDNLAIRSVTWSSASGEAGAARMKWRASGNYDRGYDWEMRWTARIPDDVRSKRITVVAEDIKGLRTARTIKVRARAARRR